MSLAAWIFKTEPSTYAFHQLEKSRRVWWDGIRNYQARNYLKTIRPGDPIWIYHSGAEKAVVGQARAVGAAVPESESRESDAAWVKIEIEAVRPCPRPILLQELRAHLALKTMVFNKQSRLSVSPLTENEHQTLLGLAGCL